MKKQVSGLLALLLAASLLTGCGNTAPTQTNSPGSQTTQAPSGEATSAPSNGSSQAETRIITDIAGREVTIPANPTRVASLVGPGFEKIILLGAVDKVVITGNKSATTSWAKVVSPEFANIPVTENATDPNIEELVELGVEVVFYWDSYPEVIEKLDQVGIATVVTQLGSGNPQSIDEFIDFQKREVMIFGEVLGGLYKTRAEEWCKFFDAKIKATRDLTDSLTPEQRPDVYYVRGPEALTIHGRNSYTMWLVELAGGNLVSRDSEIELLYTTTMEDVVTWDPEYIFMGRVNSTDIIMNDPAFQTIRAVKENKVFVNPKGVMVWDYSSEGFLLMEFVAKTLHPDIFSNLDVIQEIKDYFRDWYGYTLSDDEVQRIYNFQDPAE
jgi:iron complex transport system substrate-binding protein